jgi:isoleucyl-tRNA synthetase
MYDFKEKEQKILLFWKNNKIFEKSMELRKNAKRFVFFEGPPTANGRPGIHHFLGRAFKDLFCRYKTMRGFYVIRKAGWDTHGLPVELEVEKELKFKSKKDIEKFGIAQFNKKAKESVWKYQTEWEEMTKRMGFWLDTDNPYVTYDNKYIESLWAIIKKIWDKGLLYLAHRVVPFCTRCGTSLSSHEVAQGYRTTTDKSVIVKFEIQNSKSKINSKFKIKNSKLFILAWTTTPWTLPGNVALAVGNDIDYSIVEQNKENYIVAKILIEKVFGTDYSKFKIQNLKLKGKDLVGLSYKPLFNVKELQSRNSYKIYDADFVSTEDGTGVVHTAVMYGEDDYNLGTKIGLPKFHTVDEHGKFTDSVKEFKGMYVKDSQTEDLIIDKLKDNNNLFKTEYYEHEYPFCWRCGTPLLYYAKESWFIKISSLRDKLVKNNDKVNWIPKHIKEGRFGQWLRECKDWAFSRERYWGTPLPIWQSQIVENQKPLTNKKTNSKSQSSNSQNRKFLVIGSFNDFDKYRYGKANIYWMMRHGEAESNVKKIIDPGSHNFHLTNVGRKQVEQSAALLKRKKIDFIITSPVTRTRETAEIVGKILGIKVKTDERLREIQLGPTLSGCHDFKYHEMYPSYKLKFEQRPVDGESLTDLRARQWSLIKELEKKYEGKNILLVSHEYPIWLFMAVANGWNQEETIIEKEKRGSDFVKFAKPEPVIVRNLPRDENGYVDVHRPYIDDIVLAHPKTAEKMVRIPDLCDVWFDSGAMPFAQWHWPFENKKIFKNQFPADFIVEAIDQTRGWFYTLLAVSTLLDKGTPYKNVMSLSHVLDEKGQKMSKSKGNVVSPFEVMDKFGADSVRWYFYTINSPGDYKLFSMKDVEAKLKGFIFTLQNCVRFYELYATATEKSLFNYDTKLKTALDNWILSKLNGLISEVTEKLDDYDPTTAARAIEKFVVDDFSNWWLRRSRKRKEALDLLRFILLQLAKILAPFIPFMAEDIKSRINRFHTTGHESVHLDDWPEANKKLIDKKLEEEMDNVRDIITSGLALRKENQIKVRQPLAKIILGGSDINIKSQQLFDLIKEELNVKQVVYDKNQKEKIVLDTQLSQSLIYEGYARELIRQMQDMRKEAGYKLDEKIFAQWHSDNEELSEAVRIWSDEIKKEVLLIEFNNSPHDDKVYDVEKEFDLMPGKRIWVGIKR